ncbi:MAG: proteasome accessory factor PafA2 family protein [Methanophagales archaeon]|nr:proteasome accessory factor PafA2 family protein [Methanophagales archaeon]
MGGKKGEGDLSRWQGLEHEFRVGISSESPGLYRYARFYHVDEVIRALENYSFFDGTAAVCSKLRRRNDGFLRNGSRIYICTGGHLEIATPECRDAFEVLKYDKAAELFMQIGVEEANERLRKRLGKQGQGRGKGGRGGSAHATHVSIQCWKANVEIDKRYSRGTHESYIVKRKKFVGKEGLLVPFLVLRKIFFGAGGFVAEKAGGERGAGRGERGARGGLKYVISPKAMVSKRVLTESPSQWPILSTRDEPLSAKDFYRVHVTSGEGVRSEVTRLLNNALTSYVIDAIECGKITHIEEIWNPLQTFKEISANTNGEGGWRIKLMNRRTESAIDYLNSYYLAAIEELFAERETSYWDKYVLDTFKRLCDKFGQGLLEDPFVVRRLEWVLKWWVLKNELADFEYEERPKGRFDYRSLYKMDEQAEKEIAASFEFTNLGEHDLYEQVADRVGVVRLLTEEELGEALLSPPKGSRAELRVRLAAVPGFEDAALSWNKITINRAPKIKIDMGPPSAEEYMRLFEQYPELGRRPSAVVVFLHESRSGDGRGGRRRQVLVRLLGEEEDIRGWEEEISQEIRNRIARNPYLEYLMCSNNKTYKFDELDGWDEEVIKRKVEEIKKAEKKGREEGEEREGEEREEGE